MKAILFKKYGVHTNNNLIQFNNINKRKGLAKNILDNILKKTFVTSKLNYSAESIKEVFNADANTLPSVYFFTLGM
jgi:hypothetical protein